MRHRAGNIMDYQFHNVLTATRYGSGTLIDDDDKLFKIYIQDIVTSSCSSTLIDRRFFVSMIALFMVYL